MQVGRKNCTVAFYAKKLYIIGGLKFVNEDIKEDAFPKPFHSTDVDIFTVSNANAQYQSSFEINVTLHNGICDCISLVKNENEIVIFKDYLLKNDSDTDYRTDSKFILNLKTKMIEKASEEELPYTAYSCSNCLHFKESNICIPQFLESTYPEIEVDGKPNESVGHTLLNLTIDKVEMIDYIEN